MRSVFLGAVLAASAVTAHIGAYAKGMYCLDGMDPNKKYNSDDIVKPLYKLSKEQWWMHAFDGCNRSPPQAGDFLELPAGGSFMVEMAANRGKTTLAFDGKYTTEWGDGLNHPDDYNDPNCISSPQLHAENYTMVAGSAFAISYHSDLSAVTPENLVVFTTNRKAPWKRVAYFQVPKDLPPCPDGGCVCAWGWVPDGCGQPNIYMTPFRCKVTGSTSTKKIAPAKPPVWCDEDPGTCTKGAKQMIFWNQASGNNIEVSGLARNGRPKSPAYNEKCGFTDGAQNDIFIDEGSSGTPQPPKQEPSKQAPPQQQQPQSPPPSTNPPKKCRSPPNQKRDNKRKRRALSS